ncbi:YoaK family protein [Romboutsia sp. 1001216sp1]|uniref:YoaK family protein n=1 Tax=Romboutsia TaxID=1501226 RepID=UPI000ADAF081|nr:MULTISPECIES: YoaK family protein [Romboutsia]MDB8792613.1 YoaK family protein [Romboutsia sp. 1001216sp1]MDB8796220.1 YoaK family protein [Romboutsia sp. 1001216sp1]MDB8798213.1 YoaK family protein [Romboutsia sp. 1001216sp1]
MKNNKIKQKVPPWEKPIFIMIVTIVGGYMNGYTYITRHHILANMHTANMSKLGINIALGQWQGALSYFIPIVACILGAAFSELVKALLVIHKFKGDWRKLALILEAIALFFIGLIPTSFPDIIVTNLVSFFMGYQLCLFRECLGIAFNTTICTGNIRNVGQLLYSALDEKSKDSIRKLIIFTCLTFSFALGAIPGTLISIAISTKAVWVCSFILLTQAVWINIYECSMV